MKGFSLQDITLAAGTSGLRWQDSSVRFQPAGCLAEDSWDSFPAGPAAFGPPSVPASSGRADRQSGRPQLPPRLLPSFVAARAFGLDRPGRSVHADSAFAFAWHPPREAFVHLSAYPHEHAADLQVGGVHQFNHHSCRRPPTLLWRLRRGRRAVPFLCYVRLYRALRRRVPGAYSSLAPVKLATASWPARTGTVCSRIISRPFSSHEALIV